MPQVPRITEPRVRQAPIPNVNVRAEVPPDALPGGPADQRVLQAAQGLASKTFDVAAGIRQKEYNDANEIAVRDADVAASNRETEIALKMREKRGRDAMGAADFVEQRWAESMSEIRGTLNNDDQRLAFDRRAAQRQANLNRAAQVHAFDEVRRHDAESSQALVRSEQERAAINYGVGGVPEQSLFVQEQEIVKHMERQGHGADDPATTLAIAQARSQTHRKILERMLTEGDDAAARDYDAKIGKEILSDDRRILDIVRRTTMESRRDARNAIVNGLYMEALEGRDRDLLPVVEQLFRDGVIERSDYKELRSVLLNPYDRLEIPEEQKSAALIEIVNAFKDIGGYAELGPRGSVSIEPLRAKRKARRGVEEFRTILSENQGLISKEDYRMFLRASQKPFDDKMAAKVGRMGRLTELFSNLGFAASAIAGPAFAKAFNTLDPSVPVEKATEVMAQIEDEAKTAANPNRSRYELGKIYTSPDGRRGKVADYDEIGNPIWEIVE